MSQKQFYSWVKASEENMPPKDYCNQIRLNGRTVIDISSYEDIQRYFQNKKYVEFIFEITLHPLTLNGCTFYVEDVEKAKEAIGNVFDAGGEHEYRKRFGKIPNEAYDKNQLLND